MKKALWFLRSGFGVCMVVVGCAFWMPAYAQEASDTPQPEEEIVFPTTTLAPLTERFILDEVKDLRVKYEQLRREFTQELVTKEFDFAERAISYSANTVSYFFFFITMAGVLLAIFGWQTLKDVKNSAKQIVEREVEKMMSEYRERFERIEDDLTQKGEEIVHNQEEIERTQEMSTLWLRVNRETDERKKLELLDEILEYDPDNDDVYVMKSGSCLRLNLPEMALEFSNKAIELNSSNSRAFYNRAKAQVKMDMHTEALSDLRYACTLSQGLLERAENDDSFKPLKKGPVKKDFLQMFEEL